MKRQIDILFATHNGQKTLGRMLEALQAIDAPDRPWRLVAVDNASNDDTAAILKLWSARLPLEIEHCAVPGKLGAIAAIAHRIEGDLVVLVDDDIIPDRAWLKAYERAADENPEAAIFGGAIEPFPIEETEPWYGSIGQYTSDLFSETSAPRGPVIGADRIYGPNMMFRQAAVLEALSATFVLGPTFVEKNRKRVFPLGDESQLIAQLEQSGRQAFFVPEASVKHMVRRFQTSLDFMLQRAQNHGRGVALRGLTGRGDWRGRAGIALASLLRVIWIWPRTWPLDRKRPDTAAFASLYGLNWHAGRVKGTVFGPFAPSP